jgi:hydroxymethylpyrimidine/phosphomethylpyrimidine kinase
VVKTMIGISIAGFDPSGGAGVLSDEKTFASLGIHGTGVITSLTAQNPKKFFSVFPIPNSYVVEQFDSIMDDYEVKYGKTGMLYSKEIIETVYNKLKEYNINYIVDPVIMASTGGKLAKGKIGDTLKKTLLRDTLLATPNTKEAAILSKIAINNIDDAIEASYEIAKVCDVLITGGHLNGTSILNNGNKVTLFKNKLINSDNTHGSGCCLSTAITSYLIKGYDLKIAIEKANSYVKLSIENGWYGTLKNVF